VPERDLLRRIAARLAGDQPVDWDEAERQAATDAERAEVRHLRVVATMAGFHRSELAGDANLEFSLSTEVPRREGKAGSWLGEAGGLAGDVNGDGSPELWISAPSRDGRAGNDIGRVEVFLGGHRR